ncbi:MAG TPA: hypothetical protein VN260_06495 [Dissulfurispiraceae bacterium]|nr:hypothetical protein [Dissulfurispiraceae bacterium]
MRIKKYVGENFKEALDLVKRELGPEAVILSSKAVRNGPFGITGKEGVEVTAALDADLARHDTAASGMDDLIREIRGLRQEVTFLKEMLRPVMPGLRVGTEGKELLNHLMKQGIDMQFALVLVDQCRENRSGLREAIAGTLKVQSPVQHDDNGFIFLGPPGVGKTTTLSKMAYILAARRKQVHILSLDERGPNVEYLRETAKVTRSQFKVVRKISELPRTVYRDMEKGPVLIDTSGSSCARTLSDMKTLFPSGAPVRTCFLMDASLSQDASQKVWSSCQFALIDTIGFTKLDLASHLGNMYNIALLSGRPLSFITTGPDVPGDVVLPTADLVAGMIVGERS